MPGWRHTAPRCRASSRVRKTPLRGRPGRDLPQHDLTPDVFHARCMKTVERIMDALRLFAETGGIDPIIPAAAWTLLDTGCIQVRVVGHGLDWATEVFS